MDTKIILETMGRKFESIDGKLNVMDKKIDTGFAAVYKKIDILDDKIGVLDGKINVLDNKIDTLDNKVEVYRKVIVDRFDQLENRIDDLGESKVSYGGLRYAN